MSDWPHNLAMGPIREWPGPLTERRTYSPFTGPGGQRTPLSTTLEQFRRELRALGAQNAEMLIAMRPDQFRLDGKPYANAKADHPGVIISFDIPKVGRVSYPCDAFTRWEDNLRAVVLALEALRKVDRYGVVRHGEQYRGFLAIESAPTAFGGSTDAAARLIWTMAGRPADPALDLLSAYDGDEVRLMVRRAKRYAHPDQGGTADDWAQVIAAEGLLQTAGVI